MLFVDVFVEIIKWNEHHCYPRNAKNYALR